MHSIQPVTPTPTAAGSLPTALYTIERETTSLFTIFYSLAIRPTVQAKIDSCGIFQFL